MNSFINIVSKAEMMQPSQSVGGILFAISLAILLIPTIISYIVTELKHKELIKVVWVEIIAGAVALVFSVVSSIIIVPKFLEPTGKYVYKAIIDKNNITVAQYEEFIEKYKPEIKDGYYYFESEDNLEVDNSD